MQLRHTVPLPEVLDLKIYFTRQIAQILGRSLMVFGDDLVTGTVITNRLAERDVHIERQGQRHRPSPALLQRLDIVLLGEGFNETISGWIRGVPWSRDVESLEQFVGNGMTHKQFSSSSASLCIMRKGNPLILIKPTRHTRVDPEFLSLEADPCSTGCGTIG
ncbi:hypothetical protein FQZ97_919430 [compost metagenome]